MNVVTSQSHYTISFEYNPAYVNFCANLQGARWDVNLKVWRVVRNLPNAIDLNAAGYYYDPEMLKGGVNLVQIGSHNWYIKAELFKHQEDWAEWCKDKPKALLVAEMGLGKTLMAMQWLAAHGLKPDNVVIVCPNSLVTYWVHELKRFTGQEAHAVLGNSSNRVKQLRKPGVHVINYDYLSAHPITDRDSVVTSIWTLLKQKTVQIYDESHKLKNPTSQRSKVMHQFTAKATHVLELTGTPVSQGAQDYYSQMKCINPLVLGASFTAFKNRYCIQEDIRGAPIGVKKIVGYKQLEELMRIIKPYVFTLLKKDCLDLPEKFYSTRYVELSSEQRKAYNKLKTEMILWIRKAKAQEKSSMVAIEQVDPPITAQNILTRLLRLSQIAQGFISSTETGDTHEFSDNPKADALADILEDAGSKPLIITYRFDYDFKTITKVLEKKKISFGYINGKVPAEERQVIADTFQQGGFQVMVGEVRTIGVGLNLDRADTMICFSNNYSLVDRLQVEDRIHRVTTKSASCQYIDIVALDTVDEEVVKALRSKKEVADTLTEMQLTLDF